SVVTATPGTPGTLGTPGTPGAPGAAALRAALERSLPAHMVPAAFAFPAQLPLQPNGKVDRRALQAAAWGPAAAAATAAAYVAPRTAEELLLARLWSEVLGFESAGGGAGGAGGASAAGAAAADGGMVRIGSDDSFFALGGHSLSGARLLARLRQETGVELPLRCLFEAPSLAELARRLAAARAQRPAAGPAAAVPAAAGRAAGRPLPLSFAQRRLWLVAQLEPNSAAYNIAGAVRIAGELDVARLSWALDGLVRRHEALRTTFGGVPAAMGAEAAASPESGGGAGAADPGEPSQVILAPFHLPLPMIDLAALAEPAREPEARRLAAAAARQPFALAGGRLLRTSLLRRGGESHLLLVTLHHVISDGRSHAIFLRDLAALYGRARLPALPCQYADWARWERQSLRDVPPAAALAYWRDRLAGLPPALALPADRQRPPRESSRGGRAPLALPPALAGELTALGRRCRATPFMVLLAALDVLLLRVTGRTDLAVGTVVDQRASRGEGGGQPPPAGDLIGCFVNTLLLRADLSGNPRFDGLLGRVRDAVLADLAQQQLPFDLLVEELAPRRGPAAAAAGQALVQVMLAVQMDPLPAVAAPGLVLEAAAVETGTAKFDLTLDLMRDRAGGLGGSLEYRRDLFDAASAARLAGQLQVLLAAIAAGAGRSLDELPLHTAAERHQLLVEWGESAAAYPRQSSIHELFAIQARRRPEAIAVACGACQLSYDELRRRGNRLARRLRRMGVGLEVPVALWVERSTEMVVALLGTLAAGGAYLPLDPSFPPHRLRLILAQTGAPVMLTARRLRGRLAAGVIGEGLQVLSLDDEARALADESDADLETVTAGPDDLAYVMYTSGSTGVPKGVAVKHRGVVRLVRGTWFADFGSDQVFLQLAPLAFDASTLEIWGPLLGGGRLAIFPPGPPDPRQLGETIARHGVTTLWLTAGLFHQLVEANPRGLRGLRQLLAGGDVLSAPHVRRALQELAGGVLVNGYGPTENTTFTTCHQLRAGLGQAAEGLGAGGGEHGASVPIGRPVANSTVVLWDPRGLPVPVGVWGELMAGGDGLARGYLGSPDLTAERFVPDPAGGRRGEPGARLYRTGDLARWLPDGNLEFLGRADRQVKLRGFRIEPGEIEAALARHPEVARAAVVVGESGAGEGTLLAFVVARPGSRLAAGGAEGDGGDGAGELRALAARELPAYMVPAAFCLLPELPLTANGKVDRNALRQMAPRARPEAEAAGSPRTPMEELVAGLWCELLGCSRAGADDDFFQLGGHSLLAVRLGTRLQALLGVEVPLARLFELSRLRDLARELEVLGRGDRPGPEPIRRLAGGAPAPLSFAQERLWFLDQLEPGSATYNVPAALRLDGRLEVAALAAGLGEIRRRHQVLRSRFVAVGSARPAGPADAAADRREAAAVAEVLPAEPLSRLPLADLSTLPGPRREAEAARLRRAAARRPFDLAGGPPWRAALLRRSAGSHLLLLTLHHIACDGWSVEVLARELAVLYAAAVSGAAPALPELSLQYADFARWQRRWLAGDTLAGELAWWREQLAGARGEPPPLDLPLDRPRPPAPGSRGAWRLVELPPALAAELAALARRHGVTLFMTLLATLASLLRRYGGQTDMAVGTPVANRGRPEIQDLVGLFVNTLVLRLDLAGDPGFGDLLARTRQTALGAYAHQDVPFDKLVGDLAAHRGPAAAPFFQVFCALQSALPALAWPGVAGGFLDADADTGTGTAKFDLSLAVSPAADGSLAAAWTYRTELFDAATVERLAGQWRLLLADAVAAPDRRLSELRLLGPAERHQLLVEWNATGFAGGGDDLVHVPFERQAALDPAAVALVAVSDADDRHDGNDGGVRTLTYGELEARAERLAGELRALGVGPDRLVAICAEPSFALIAGLLAILKAGGAYLPLDPAHPPERLAQTLADSGARLVLAERRLAGLLPAGVQVALLDGEAAAAGLAVPATGLAMPAAGLAVPATGLAMPATGLAVPATGLSAGAAPAPAAAAPPAWRAHPDNAAYVLYTSGSTGTPKGVVVSHRAVANRLRYQVAADFAPGARVLQRTRLGFDVSAVEVFAPLWSGAVVVVAPPSCQQDPDALARLIVEQRVTNANLPPAMLAALLANEGFCRRGSLRVVVTGADKVPGELPRRFHAAMAAPAPRLISRYGPTEATISVSGFPCGAEPLGQLVPLGRPIAGARLYLLDGGLRELPVGALGEICIAGRCLARGYLGRPDLTAAAFLPDPFARGETAAGGRLYRTGDLGRLHADGTFQFLGRADHQVKIRGFRIELGEIEAVLSRHPRLQQAVVVDRDEPATGGRRLVAYVVPHAGTPDGEVDPPRLRGYLEGKLPAYMVPAAFVVLDALPLTANGKVDRQALPAPPANPLAAGAGAGVAPRSQLERTIAGIWRELLQVEQIGIHDNFFDLGGHSLLLARVRARLQEALERPVPILDLFRHPTVEALARHLGQPATPGAAWAEAVRRRAAHRQAALGIGPPPGAESRASGEPRQQGVDGGVAVIGLAGRFPGADGVAQFWDNLCGGVESIQRLSPAAVAAVGAVDPGLAQASGYVPADGVLAGIELFDAAFFGLLPTEAELMDPQQRIFLECASDALEDAGCDPERYPGLIGVYAGTGANSYGLRNLLGNPAALRAAGVYQALLSNDKDFLATGTSYRLNLKGPSVSVQCACSTSLVAVHFAVQALLTHDCDVALAGGVRVRVPQHGYIYQEGGILSPDGHCRAFDADAAGTVPGQGAGVVVLKRLADALADGDAVRAVIRGVAMNNDGSHKVGFAAPSVAGQAAVIAAAMAMAGIEPRDVSYVEAHGTGTALGDPIEVAALNQVFGGGGQEKGSCAL
ncbi:MAG TPA: amino acid adenylation domain-containing protein, partial [Thermoanaerobaculia bacterium]|nr:amino acid adenylation domain-containing protein [Thermoanaerobaculia bacterium]